MHNTILMYGKILANKKFWKLNYLKGRKQKYTFNNHADNVNPEEEEIEEFPWYQEDLLELMG